MHNSLLLTSSCQMKPREWDSLCATAFQHGTCLHQPPAGSQGSQSSITLLLGELGNAWMFPVKLIFCAHRRQIATNHFRCALSTSRPLVSWRIVLLV